MTMLKFSDAFDIAVEHFKKIGVPDILEAYETDDAYIVFGGLKSKIELPGSGIIIDKTLGEVHDFILNSKENYGILNRAKEIEFW